MRFDWLRRRRREERKGVPIAGFAALYNDAELYLNRVATRKCFKGMKGVVVSYDRLADCILIWPRKKHVRGSLVDQEGRMCVNLGLLAKREGLTLPRYRRFVPLWDQNKVAIELSGGTPIKPEEVKVDKIKGVLRSNVEKMLRTYGTDKTVPTGVMSRMAEDLDCSKERIRQIAESLGYKVRPKNNQLYCIDCGAPVSGTNLRCMKCSSKFETLPNVRCEVCGKPIHRTKVQDHYFCSKKCQGEWLGINYGAGARQQRPRKKPELVTVKCAYCGKEIQKHPRLVREQNFCCRSHVMKWRCEVLGWSVTKARAEKKRQREQALHV